MFEQFSRAIEPDWRGLRRCILREGTPERVHHIELFLDPEVQQAVCERFNLLDGLSPADDSFDLERQVRIQSFLGYDYVRAGVEEQEWVLRQHTAADTAGLKRGGGREYVDMQRGPIANWDDFERYPWPDPAKASFRALEWLETRLPESMCVMAHSGFGHFAELLSWLMGYETLCTALFEQRDLVEAIARKLEEHSAACLAQVLRFDRVGFVWASDDMGFRTGPLISPADMREFVLPGHTRLAKMAHDAGRPYLLHSCGRLDLIMEDLIDDVKVDARHSFEDAIEPVTKAYAKYHERVALLGGIDVDFLCRNDAEAVRARVRDTLRVCQPGGGYCLGTGNSVANYIPVDNYLAMLDEGRRFGG